MIAEPDPAAVAVTAIAEAGTPVAGTASDTITLDYESRLIRRKILTTDAGRRVLVNFASVQDLPDGGALVLADGSVVAVQAAVEDLVDATGDLPRLAWHVGNRHTPCQVLDAALRLRRDPVLENMLEQLGAQLSPVRAPFLPEGGAYGQGRTFGHSHHPAETHGAHD